MHHHSSAAIAAALVDIDAMFASGGLAPAGDDVALMPVAADTPKAIYRLTAGHPVFDDPAVLVARGKFGEIKTLARFGDTQPTPATELLALYVEAGALPKPYFDRVSSSITSHLCVDLYGWHPASGLLVAQVRESCWDARRCFGDMSKTYALCDAQGRRVNIPHGKVRGAIRRDPADMSAPVIGAIADAFRIKPREALRRLQAGMVDLGALNLPPHRD